MSELHGDSPRDPAAIDASVAASVEQIQAAPTDDDARRIEAELIEQTDNTPRPEDGPQPGQDAGDGH